MDVIRRQVPNVNLPSLRNRARQYFPVVEYYLRETGLPQDFKYLAIVESGFQNLTSKVGAGGFWQLMPKTAAGLGLTVSASIDEREDIYKSTYAACRLLASYYKQIKSTYGIYSWVLTAAAYNIGIGNMTKAINKQGNDYFSMNLNPETAMYVYKIIAVKELFEYPELYMQSFGYNIFSAQKSSPRTNTENITNDTSIFQTLQVNVSENDGTHPAEINVKQPVNNEYLNNTTETIIEPDVQKFQYITAYVDGKYKKFTDGEIISFELNEDLKLKGSYTRQGNKIMGKGWLIDDRVFVDLGYGDHGVILLDAMDAKKGLALSSLKNKQPVLLKVGAGEN